MQGMYRNISVKGIVSVVPKNRKSNVEYAEKMGSKRIKKQVSLTGIEFRHVCREGQHATDLATVALNNLLHKIGWNDSKIDVLIYVTQSPAMLRPSTAFILQKRAEINIDCLVYDINLGCSGYVAGIETIAAILSTTKGKGILVVGESLAMDDSNPLFSSNSLLDGDGASATAFEYSHECEQTILFEQHSDGSRANFIYQCKDSVSHMDGNEVLLFGLNDVADDLAKFMEVNGLEEKVDYIVLHQAQKMIVDGVVQSAKLDMDKVLYSCQEYANTSSASIPITLCSNLNRERMIGRKNILLCGFGIGLSWGIVYLELDCNNIYSMIESDEIFIEEMWIDDKGKKD